MQFTITLTEPQMQALAGLLDAGIKAVGIRGVKDAAGLLDALEAAEQKPTEQETDNG
jgi:hypothetical protein